MEKDVHHNIGSIEELVDNFSYFSDWEERYRYLIDLGRNLEHMDDAVKTDENLVRGCTSRVWMIGGFDGDVFRFQADSDAHIVRGLIMILYVAYMGKKLAEISSLPIENIFKEIGLDQNLSPNRRNGFYSMVEKIKAFSQL